MKTSTDKLDATLKAGLEVRSIRLTNDRLIWNVQSIERTNVPDFYLVRYLKGAAHVPTAEGVYGDEVDEIRVRS